MSLKTITDALCLLVFIGLSVYDVLPYLSKADGDTISEAVQYAASRVLVIPFAFGVLLGHWHMPRADALFGQPASVFLLLWLAFLVFVLGLSLRHFGLTTSLPFFSFLVIVFGLLSGHFLWPMKPL